MQMRKNILYCFIFFLFTACINENMDDCWQETRIRVAYKNEVEAFDQIIGNDVHLHIYQQNNPLKEEILPYSSISNGKEVIYRDGTPGNYQVLGFAVSKEDNSSTIPAFDSEKKLTGYLINLPRKDEMFYHPLDYLFIGQQEIQISYTKSSAHTISMTDAVCRVYIIIQNADFFQEGDNGFWVELEGTYSSVDLDLKYAGEPANIYKKFTYKEDTNELVTGRMGVFPSAEDQYLKAIVYRDSRALPLFQVETQYKATIGGEIYIIVTGRTSVEIYIDGWKEKDPVITSF